MCTELLPSKIYTPSSCICELHPDEIGLSWMRGNKKTKSEYQGKLGITKNEFLELQRWGIRKINRLLPPSRYTKKPTITIR